jgi:hypothetical protein
MDNKTLIRKTAKKYGEIKSLDNIGADWRKTIDKEMLFSMCATVSNTVSATVDIESVDTYMRKTNSGVEAFITAKPLVAQLKQLIKQIKWKIRTL